MPETINNAPESNEQPKNPAEGILKDMEGELSPNRPEAEELGKKDSKDKMKVKQETKLTDEEIKEKSEGFPEVKNPKGEDKEDMEWAINNFEEERGMPMKDRDIAKVGDENGTYGIVIMDEGKYRYFRKAE